MNTRSTQRFIGFVVAAVASALVLMALPAKEKDPEAPDLAAPELSAGVAGAVELPVFEVEDGWWMLPRYGVRMQLPAGWEPGERYKRPFAYREPPAMLAGSLNVLSLPNFFGADLARLAEENRASLAASDVLELIGMHDHTLGGDQAALWIDYGGHPAGEELRFAGIVFLWRGQQVVITAAATAEQWPVIEAELLASLKSIELLPREE